MVGDFLTSFAPLIGSLSGGVTVLLIVLMLVARGHLVPGATHKEMRKDAQDRIAATVEDYNDRTDALREDRNYWREVALDLMNTVGAAVLRGTGKGEGRDIER